jgi:hypothetical protein
LAKTTTSLIISRTSLKIIQEAVGQARIRIPFGSEGTANEYPFHGPSQELRFQSSSILGIDLTASAPKAFQRIVGLFFCDQHGRPQPGDMTAK